MAARASASPSREASCGCWAARSESRARLDAAARSPSICRSPAPRVLSAAVVPEAVLVFSSDADLVRRIVACLGGLPVESPLCQNGGRAAHASSRNPSVSNRHWCSMAEMAIPPRRWPCSVPIRVSVRSGRPGSSRAGTSNTRSLDHQLTGFVRQRRAGQRLACLGDFRRFCRGDPTGMRPTVGERTPEPARSRRRGQSGQSKGHQAHLGAR